MASQVRRSRSSQQIWKFKHFPAVNSPFQLINAERNNQILPKKITFPQPHQTVCHHNSMLIQINRVGICSEQCQWRQPPLRRRRHLTARKVQTSRVWSHQAREKTLKKRLRKTSNPHRARVHCIQIADEEEPATTKRSSHIFRVRAGLGRSKA